MGEGGRGLTRDPLALYTGIVTLSDWSNSTPHPSSACRAGVPTIQFHRHRESALASKYCEAHPSPVSHSYRGPPHVPARVLSLWSWNSLQGAPSPVETFTHTKLHMQILRTLQGGALVCPLQSSLLAVLYTHRHGAGADIQLWGKELKFMEYLNNTMLK